MIASNVGFSLLEIIVSVQSYSFESSEPYVFRSLAVTVYPDFTYNYYQYSYQVYKYIVR